MKTKKDKDRQPDGLDKYPVNIQQAIHLLASVLRRMEAAGLDKKANGSLSMEVSKGGKKK